LLLHFFYKDLLPQQQCSAKHIKPDFKRDFLSRYNSAHFTR